MPGSGPRLCPAGGSRDPFQMSAGCSQSARRSRRGGCACRCRSEPGCAAAGCCRCCGPIPTSPSPKPPLGITATGCLSGGCAAVEQTPADRHRCLGRHASSAVVSRPPGKAVCKKVPAGGFGSGHPLGTRGCRLESDGGQIVRVGAGHVGTTVASRPLLPCPSRPSSSSAATTSANPAPSQHA